MKVILYFVAICLLLGVALVSCSNQYDEAASITQRLINERQVETMIDESWHSEIAEYREAELDQLVKKVHEIFGTIEVGRSQ